MNELTQQEFQIRLVEHLLAKKIFIDTGVLERVDQAYEAYQEILAEEKKPVYLSTKSSGNRPPAAFDGLNRPTCPVCEKGKMMFRPIPPNQKIKIQLLCEDPLCDTALNSLEEVGIWIERMKSGEPIDVSSLERVSKRAPIPGRKYTWINLPCPKCGERLYEMEKCCGAPEGLIECSGCDWQMPPSEFYSKYR